MKFKKTLKLYYSFAFLVLFNISTNAQEGVDQIVNNDELRIMIDSISSLIEENYISVDMGMKMSNTIKINQKNGNYNNLSFGKLAKQLTKDLRSISDDVHMSTYYYEQKKAPQESILSSKNDKRGSLSNFGFTEVKILENNIGYLRIDHFTKWKFFDDAKKAVDNSIGILQNSDALIIDLRDNPGGFEEIVAYLVSYFQDVSEVNLQEYYCRYQNSRSHIKITEKLPNEKLLEPTVYILVSKKTGSAAESFAYIMKHLNRATIIGETTVGAGNGSREFRVLNNFFVQISVCETINTVTQKSWEKVGVVPHIEIEKEQAFDKAFELAKLTSLDYRNKLMKSYEKLLSDLNGVVESSISSNSGELLVDKIIECQGAKLITENDINILGYEFLGKFKNSLIAEEIFKINTELYPNSANVYDSYAEALLANNKKEQAIANYKKAVEIASKNNHPNLEVFQKGLDKLIK